MQYAGPRRIGNFPLANTHLCQNSYTAARLWAWKGDSDVAVTYCTADHEGNGKYMLHVVVFMIAQKLLKFLTESK